MAEDRADLEGLKERFLLGEHTHSLSLFLHSLH